MSTDHDHLQSRAALKALAEKRQRWVDANIENAFDEGIKTLLTELYPEHAHFIFELLQNAEDKHAHEVTFRLYSDRLVVVHNGPDLFTLSDIDAITSIGKSPKRHDTTKIGKFGVGFKSVFAYTDTPEVYSGHFHFRIRDLVVPDTTGVPHAPFTRDTQFVFPFNNSHKPAADAAKEIERGLVELADTTLLFLKHIHTLRYQLPNGAVGSIQRIPHDEGRIEIQTRRPTSTTIDRSFWLRFEKSIAVIDEEDADRTKQCPIALAYKLEQRDRSSKDRKQTSQVGLSTEWKIVPVESGQVSIYFPAVKEDSRLRFCLHAPFASTVARDSVRDCRANDTLRDHLAELTADSLISIRDNGLLTIDFLAVLPLASDGLSPFYEPFLKAALEAFQTRALTPTLGDKHKRAAKLRKGANDVTSLLSDSDLASLTGNQFLRWAANPRQRNQREDRFLTSLGIEEWTLKDLRAAATGRVSQLAVDWLKKKEDAWFTSLYSRLNKIPTGSDHRLAAEAYPIVRLTDGSQVRLTVNGVPMAHLPSATPTTTRFKIVSPAVLTEEDATKYLVSCGYSEPDLIAEVIDHVIPLYASDTPPAVTENIAHLNVIAEAYATDSIAKRNRLDMLLKQTAFIRCKLFGSGQEGYSTPADSYFPTADLGIYFDGHPTAKAVSASYSEGSLTLLRRLGVDDLPRRCLVNSGEPPVYQHSTRETRIENYELDGLEWLLSQLMAETDISLKQMRSACLCRILTSLLERTPDGFEAKRFYFYYSPQLQIYDSLFLQKLKSAQWMVTSDGRCLKPEDVSRDELPAEMLNYSTLLTKLAAC